MGDERRFLKTPSAPLSLMTIYPMSLISAWYISLESTFIWHYHQFLLYLYFPVGYQKVRMWMPEEKILWLFQKSLLLIKKLTLNE